MLAFEGPNLILAPSKSDPGSTILIFRKAQSRLELEFYGFFKVESLGLEQAQGKFWQAWARLGLGSIIKA